MTLFRSLIVLSILILSSCSSNPKQEDAQQKQQEIVRIKGSESELPLVLKLVDYFKSHSDTAIQFNVSGGGSNIGISLLEKEQIDIAMSSRKLRDEERRYLAEKNIELGEIIVAYDALFIIVNKNNPLNKITTEQLQSIYTGKIKNWKELGGADVPIISCSRRSSSGTKSFFESVVLSGQKADASVREFDNYNSLLEIVKKEKGAIGFNSLGYINEEVKYLNVSLDKGKTFFNVQQAKKLTKENYPMVRPLYIIYKKSSEKRFKPFIDFIQTDSAKSVIKSAGFLL